MIHYYYGFGKGKTSSAIGAGMRFAGNGGKVLLVQFFKDNSSNELKSVPFEVFEAPEKIEFNPKPEEYLPWINNALEHIENTECDMIILDEFADLLPKYISEDMVREVLNKNKEYIITGHYRQELLVDMADYVTCFQKEKHPYDKGISARAGIEF